VLVPTAHEALLLPLVVVRSDEPVDTKSYGPSHVLARGELGRRGGGERAERRGKGEASRGHRARPGPPPAREGGAGSGAAGDAEASHEFHPEM
jgi:hypothetical protein